MTKETKTAKGLLAIWADVDEDYRVEYQKWHNCQHMTERVSIPGFQVGRRYQGIGEAPDFLMYYETEDSKVLSGAPYMHAINNPTPWTREAITHLRNIVRSIYRLVASAGKGAPTEASYILIIRFSIPSGNENKVIQWLKEEHLPRAAALSGVHRGRLYEMDDEVSNITTEERKIHGGKPGLQRFLAFYEISSLDLLGSKEWKESAEWIGDQTLSNPLEDAQKESYWLDFSMYAPQD
jgi:hypothetical protein